MSDLVILKNHQAVTSSLEVAQAFDKRHDHIIRDIEALKKDVPNFGEVFYQTNIPDAYGRDRKAYYMNHDGFTLLAMGFTGKKAMTFKIEFLNEFNRLEREVQTQSMDSYMINDPVERAKKWIDEERQRQALVEENNRLQIPALLGVAVSGSTKGILVGQLAKILNQNGVETGEKRLFKWLRDNGYLIKSGRQRNCPTQKSRDLGVIDVRETMITHAHGAQPSFTPLITGKGQQYFVTKLVQLNLIQC